MDENMIGECTVSDIKTPKEEVSPIGLFPNPAREHVYVETDYVDLSDMHISVKNPLGIVVIEDHLLGNVQKLNVSKLSAGLYTVHILRGDYVLGTKTLLIQ
jgi:hypothetical protein